MRPVLLFCLMALAGCAGPTYWHEPPGPAGDAPELWQGVLRSSALRYIAFTPLNMPVSVRCAGYQDLISLTREGDRLSVKVGVAGDPELELTLDAEGHFSTVVPIAADTWVYGGVMLFEEEPVLHLWGQLDRTTGLGQGRVNVSPGDERLGCPGRFQVSRNGGMPPRDRIDSPFKAQYWIDELEGMESRFFSGFHVWPSGRFRIR